MRVLLINPEVSDYFWTMPDLCRLAGRKTIMPPLGLLTLAALLPQDWEFRVVDLSARPLTDDDWNWAELAMVTGMVVHKHRMLRLVREAAERGTRVVVGGPYATSVPEQFCEARADLIVRGEAENTVPLLLRALESDGRGTVIECDATVDLTSSPIPRFDLLDWNHYIYPAIQTSRGCPFDCEFCDVVNLLGREQRYKTPDQVIAELETLYQLGWRGQIFICDDNFIGSRKRAVGILRRLIQWQESRGKPFCFGTQVSINLGRDNDLIDLMTAASFGDVFVGIESPDSGALQTAGKHQNLRGSLQDSLNNLKRNGLLVWGSFIVGADGEDPGVGERICRLVEETDIPKAMINTMWALPNTRLWNRLKQEGRLLEDLDTEEANISRPRFNFIPSRPSADIIDDYRKIWDRLYERSCFFSRTYRYFRAMRPTRKALGIDMSPQVALQAPKLVLGKRKFLDILRALLSVLWRQGILPSGRISYWSRMLKMRFKNPSRWSWYFGTCVTAEDLFRLREVIRNGARPSESRPPRGA